jgi:hypothetical protein
MSKAARKKHRQFMADAKFNRLPRKPKPPAKPARTPPLLGYRPDAVPLVQRRQPEGQ